MSVIIATCIIEW